MELIKQKIIVLLLWAMALSFVGCSRHEVPSKAWITSRFEYYVEGHGDNGIGSVIGGINSAGAEVYGSVFNERLDQPVSGRWISKGVARVIDSEGNTYYLKVK